VRDSLKSTFKFLTPREKWVWGSFTAARSTLAVFDLLGVMIIGFVAASIALFLTEGSDPARTIQFAGLEITAVNLSSLPIYVGIVLALFLSKALFSIILARRSALFLAGIDASAAKKIAQAIYGFDLSKAQRKTREEAIFAIQAGSTSAFSGVLNSLSTFLSESVLFLLISIAFFLVNPLATLGILAYFAVVALALNFFLGRRIKNYGRLSVQSTVRSGLHVSDLLGVFRESTTTGIRGEFFNRVYQAKLESARSFAIQTHLGSMPRYIIEAALLLGFTALVLYQATSSDLVQSATTLSVFLAGSFRLTAALLPLQTAVLVLKGNIPKSATALEVLDELNLTLDSRYSSQPNLLDPDSLTPPGAVFDNVTFKHADSLSPAVKNVSISIQPGVKAAIIGESGAGKSTIADLLCGLIKPDSGEVSLVMGNQRFAPEALYGHIGYVPQRPNLISGDLAENVALGIDSSLVDLDKVQMCLKQAGLWEMVSSLPEGVHTDVGNLRDNLSGGEIQRIGLARALYSDPILLVMDEATSSLDATSEAQVSQALEKLRAKVTLVVIAHRLNTVQNADQVFLMSAGKLVDTGSFSELVARNPDLEKTVNLLRID
jgi:ABC-type multidrug transport system fused ATPase/permease subunit